MPASPLVLVLLSAPLCAAYTLTMGMASPRAVAPVEASQSTLSGLRMMAESDDETSKAPAPPSPPATRDSPLAAVVGEQSLDDFEKYKAQENEKRQAIRKRNNILIPAVSLAFFAYASFIGEDTFKSQVAQFGDPLANAPGLTEAREKKAAREDKEAAERDAQIQKLRDNLAN